MAHQERVRSGLGTADDPYIISSVDDLGLYRETVNSTSLTYEGQYLKIADGAEFDLSGEQWTSIGTSSKKFMGTFDGNGAMIKGLTDGGKFRNVRSVRLYLQRHDQEHEHLST